MILQDVFVRSSVIKEYKQLSITEAHESFTYFYHFTNALILFVILYYQGMVHTANCWKEIK